MFNKSKLISLSSCGGGGVNRLFTAIKRKCESALNKWNNINCHLKLDKRLDCQFLNFSNLMTN